MAVQLILKNSAVQDKEATAAQLAAGELALNYHSSGPFLQCEDTAGNIWRLGGVVIASTAPSNPSKGAWWLDSDDNHLYFYDGSSWIEIQTGEIVPGDITEGTARQLLQTNAAGNGTEWTSNIDVPGTLDVTGVATFDNNVVITGNLTVNGTTTTIDTTTLVVEDKNIEMGAVDTPTDSTADGGGITLKGATDKTINWVNATDAWTSSERFSVPLGAQGTPSLTFTGDANTGIYSPGADQVAISTGGTGRLFVDASGKIGLNTSAPSSQFSVGSDTSAPSVISLDYNPTNTTAASISANHSTGEVRYGAVAAYFPTFYSNNLERLRIDSSGRVGVGTSSPQNALHAYHATDNGVLRLESGDEYVHIEFKDPTTTNIPYIGAQGNNLRMITGGAAAVTIDSSQRVGVGTTSPESGGKLTVAGGIYTTSSLTAAATNAGAIDFVNDGRGTRLISYGPDASTKTAISFSQGVAGGSATEIARFDSSGRLGIGTSSPSSSALLDVNGNARIGSAGNFDTDTRLLLASTGGNCYLQVQGADSTGTAGIKLGRNSAANRAGIDWSASTDKLTIRTGGTSAAITVDNAQRVGIGTTSPSEKLTVDGGICARNTSDDSQIKLSHNGTVASISATYGSTGAYDPLAFFTSDSERARIDSSGRLLVGTSSVSGDFGAVVSTGGTARVLLARESLPTSAGGLGSLGWGRNNGEVGATIGGIADANWTSGSSYPTRLVFSTTADGASSPTERVRIESGGKTKFSGGAYGIERTITPSLFNLHEGNFWTCGAIAIPNPQNQVAGFMGSIRVTAAPTSFGSHFDFPGGTYTAPTSFPAVAPFFVQASGTILVGSWTEGIA